VPKPDTQDQVTVAIGRDGRDVSPGASRARGRNLATKLNELFENKHEKMVFVRADEEAQYGKVMAAMDELRAAQIEDIALITGNTAGSGGK